MKYKFFIIGLSIILLLNLVNATISIELADQGSGVKTISTGSLLSSGNLSVYIYDSLTDGNLIYSENFSNAIINGSWNVILGENSTNLLYLQYNRKYYKDYKINNEDVNFTFNNGTSVGRKGFYSPLGEIGLRTISNIDGSTAFGVDSNSTGSSSTAIGDHCLANNSYSVAIGAQSVASNFGSVAIGYQAISSGWNGIAIGGAAHAYGWDSVALGSGITNGMYATAIGYGPSASYGATSLGFASNASGAVSTAMGYYSTVTGDYSFVWGGANCLPNVNCINNKTNLFAIYGGLCVANATTNCPATGEGYAYIDRAITLNPRSLAPSSPSEGMIYYSTTYHKPCYYNGTAWKLFNESICS